MRTYPSAVAGASLLVAALAVSALAQTPPPAVPFHPPAPPEQPITYSHQQHLALGLQCAGCHDGATSGPTAKIPATATCMTCHATVKTDSPEIQKLVGFHSRQEAVPWKRVYRLPEFVWFNHAVHMSASADITCETCHGDVKGMALMQKVKDTSMAACVQCHTERAAPIRCDSCHETRG